MNILITGGTGMVGSAFKSVTTSHNLILVGSKDYDLTNPLEATAMVIKHRPDAIIHLAARVGGVKGNMERVADFFQQNILINTNVLNAALNFSEDYAGHPIKVLSLLSTCIYPDKVKYPLTVDQIHNGPPHDSNFGYAYAKRMLDVHTRAIKAQYNYNWITAVPNNIYGKYDNFSLEHSHVIPALIRKIYNAKISGDQVTLWGDGTPLREFTYSVDIAEILIWMIENYTDIEPLNIGNPTEYSIKDVARIICDELNYPFDKILWDINQPAGQFRKPSDNKNLNKLMGPHYTDLRGGLKKTIDWYVKSYPDVRGVK